MIDGSPLRSCEIHNVPKILRLSRVRIIHSRSTTMRVITQGSSDGGLLLLGDTGMAMDLPMRERLTQVSERVWPSAAN